MARRREEVGQMVEEIEIYLVKHFYVFYFKNLAKDKWPLKRSKRTFKLAKVAQIKNREKYLKTHLKKCLFRALNSK